MFNYKKRTLDFLEIEWGTYVERFNRWPKEDGIKRVNDQGYQQLRDMLAHVLAWWDEGMEIILAIAEKREYARKKYDFDAFNANAIAKYRTWDEQEFFAHFEKMRQKTVASLSSMNEAAWEDVRAQRWIHAVFIDHAREHLVALSRFLALDTLQNEWATYIEKFNQIEDKDGFVKKQGVETFHDLLAHVIGWWEECARMVNGILYQPGFTWDDHQTDLFNVELTKKYSSWSFDDLLKHYETTRLAMIELVQKLPEHAFVNNDVESWLAADLVGHYDGHPL